MTCATKCTKNPYHDYQRGNGLKITTGTPFTIGPNGDPSGTVDFSIPDYCILVGTLLRIPTFDGMVVTYTGEYTANNTFVSIDLIESGLPVTYTAPSPIDFKTNFSDVLDYINGLGKGIATGAYDTNTDTYTITVNTQHYGKIEPYTMTGENSPIAYTPVPDSTVYNGFTLQGFNNINTLSPLIVGVNSGQGSQAQTDFNSWLSVADPSGNPARQAGGASQDLNQTLSGLFKDATTNTFVTVPFAPFTHFMPCEYYKSAAPKGPNAENVITCQAVNQGATTYQAIPVYIDLSWLYGN